jgi:hypothetical protein
MSENPEVADAFDVLFGALRLAPPLAPGNVIRRADAGRDPANTDGTPPYRDPMDFMTSPSGRSAGRGTLYETDQADLLDAFERDRRVRVYIDVGGMSGPYLEIDDVHYYENGVKGQPSIILVAHPERTAEIQKDMMLRNLSPAIERAKAALQSLIAIEAPDTQQIDLLRPRDRKTLERPSKLKLIEKAKDDA